MSKENIAGVEIDISKVIGQELAKIASGMISEERLNNLVKYEIDKLVDKPTSGYGWNNKESEITTQTTNAFMIEIGKRIDEIMSSDEHKEFINQRAKAIYDMAIETATKYMVEAIARKMSINAFDVDNVHSNCNVEMIARGIIDDHERRNHGCY